MSAKRILVVAAAAVGLVSLGACDNAATSGSSSSMGTSSSTAQQNTAAEHNHADEMFAQMMIPHHQQAIEMSDMVLGKQGIDPKVRDLATRIKDAQGPEITQMQGWLKSWGTPTMPGMTGMPGMAGGGGMMSEQDMAALQNAQGVAASRLFLTQMVAHHQGAIKMAEDETKAGAFPEARTLADEIKTTQQREIDTMNALLGSL